MNARIIWALGFLSGCASQPPALMATGHMLDLTHTLSPQFPYIPVQNKTFPFRIYPIARLSSDGVAANRWELTEHVGTHLDAPNHFVENGASIADIPLSALLVPAVVIDIRPAVARDPDAVLNVQMLLTWETAHGRIPDSACVFLLTGWSSRSGDQQTFVNADQKGSLHFPGFSPEVIDFLLRKRQISGSGIDTLSIDPGVDKSYRGHHRLVAAGRWAAECVANLEQLPPVGAAVLIAPTKVAGATGAPARIVAFW